MAYLTYFDVVEHLITASFGGPQDAEQRDIRTAVQRAYAELTQIRDWAYYSVHGRLVTSAAYSSGTVQAPTVSTVTLTGGSFATAGMTAANAKHWSISIGDTVFPVLSYDSATSLTLALPAASTFPAGSPYILYRTSYPLPEDFRNMDEPSDEFNWWSGLYVTPDQAMKIERASNSSGRPYHWTIIKDPHTTGWAIRLIGYPTTSETIDFVYRRAPRAIRYSGHEAALRQGTIARSTTAVTGTGTAFSAAMVGSILRVGEGAVAPGPLTAITPYVSESPIVAQASATSLTTGTSGTIASATAYLITDPIDVPQHMHNVIYSAAEYWLARIRNQKPDNVFAMYQRDLRLAMEQDQLAPLSGRSQEIWHDGGWRSPLKADGGT
jgi:hypothetical protein